MRYKRKEYFRYVFEEPLFAEFQIKKVKDQSVHTSRGPAEILDISPGGLCLATELNISRASRNDVELIIYFKLNEMLFDLSGQVMWSDREQEIAEYGIEFMPDQPKTEELIRQLKIYSREHLREHLE